MPKAPPPKQSRRDPEWRYWDSTVFLAWLLKEPERLADIRAVLHAAARGNVRIATSAITLTEVIHLKSLPPLAREHEKEIREFFQRSYISVRLVDRWVAEDARALIWQHGLRPKDAIHVATALRWKQIRTLETHDEHLIALNGKLGKPPLSIRRPHYAETLPLAFPAAKKPRVEKAAR